MLYARPYGWFTKRGSRFAGRGICATTEPSKPGSPVRESIMNREDHTSGGGFPTIRSRRLRHNPLVRELVRETILSVSDLILPLFVRPGRGIKKEIASMPGNYQLSTDRLIEEVGSS